MENLIVLVTVDINVINLVHQINNNFKFGFTVEIRDKNNFLKKGISENTAAVLLDVDHIAELNPYNICHHLRQNDSSVPFVVLKDQYTHHETRYLFKNGAFDCLSKTFLAQENIYKLLEELQESIQVRRQQNDDHLDSIRVSLIYNLLYGNIRSLQYVWDNCELIGLSSVPNTAMAVEIDKFLFFNKNESKETQDTIRNEIITVTRQFLKTKLDEALLMGTDVDKYAILLALPKQDSDSEYVTFVKNLAEETKAFIKEQTGYSITISIGNYYEDIRNLYVSYQEAIYAQKYKFFEGMDIVIHVSDVEPLTNDMALLRNQDVSSLASKLKVADIAAVKEQMTNLFNQLFSTEMVDPEVLKFQISEIATTLARAAVNGGASLNEVHTILLEYTTQLKMIENVKEMQESLREMVLQFADLVFNSNNEFSLKSIQKALDYIDEHYLEQITLEKVSSHVYLSPTYFSRLFKSATGTNFVEYITNKRIEKAQSLLMNLNYTVYQIALKVGYSNSHYFSRVFKSIVGKTPSEYRNSAIGKTHEHSEGKLLDINEQQKKLRAAGEVNDIGRKQQR